MLFFIGFAGILMVPLGIYLYFVISRVWTFFLGDGRRHLKKSLSVLAAVLITIPCINLFGLWALLVLYFTGFSVLLDLVWLAVKKSGIRSRVWEVAYRSGILALLLTAVVTAYAYVNMHHITVARYDVQTDKEIQKEGYRVVFVSDLHFGTTMDIQKLKEYCAQMEEEKPDLVVLGGDIVDEAASFTEAEEAFAVLAQAESTFGTYYVYGNHDKGTYSRTCDFTPEELEELIQASGVHILEDQTVQLNEELSISGRRDRSDASSAGIPREAAETLLQNVSQDGFHILTDHQPRGMDECAAAGFDLMLSGHTHGGQMWPVGLITELFDKETVNYGRKTFGRMELIVSSGIAGWGYPLRTGKHSEYVVVHIGQQMPGA